MNTSRKLLITLFSVPFLLAGCGGENKKEKTSELFSTLAVSVDQNPVYINLESNTYSTDSSQPWHLSYKRYNGFGLNGGVSGSGNVQGCIAWQAEGAYDSDGNPVKSVIQALTAATTKNQFDKVNNDSCTDLSRDQLSTQIGMDDWLSASYGPTGPSFTAKTENSNGWIVRSASADGNGMYEYARVKVTDIHYQPGNPAIRKLRFASERWDVNSMTFSAAQTSGWLDFSAGRVYWDLETNSAVSGSDGWELSVVYESGQRSWNIQVNAGISGTGSAGIGLVTSVNGNAFAVTDPTNTQQVYTFFTDKSDSIINKPGNFGPLEYNLLGTHDLTANFTIYRLTDGAKSFKVQVLSNYGADGNQGSGNLYLRHAHL